MNIKYCFEQCKTGQDVSDKLIDKNNSAIDAAIDFGIYVDECYKTCPYKDIMKEYVVNKET